MPAQPSKSPMSALIIGGTDDGARARGRVVVGAHEVTEHVDRVDHLGDADCCLADADDEVLGTLDERSSRATCGTRSSDE